MIKPGPRTNSRLWKGATNGLAMMERGMQVYHGVRGAYAAGSALAAAAAPYVATAAALL